MDDAPRRVPVTAPERACPVCGTVGEPATFEGLYLCVSGDCRVWSYEQASLPLTKGGYLLRRQLP